jgi:hypothetical protein
MRQNFEEELKRKEAEIARRRELHGLISRFVRANGGWLTSPPGSTQLQIEAPPDSEVADLLAEQGWNIAPGPTATRIEQGRFIPVRVHTLRLPPLRK